MTTDDGFPDRVHFSPGLEIRESKAQSLQGFRLCEYVLPAECDLSGVFYDPVVSRWVVQARVAEPAEPAAPPAREEFVPEATTVELSPATKQEIEKFTAGLQRWVTMLPAGATINDVACDLTRLPNVGPFTNFTDRARRVFQLANMEAQRWDHEYLGAEHLLVGLVKEGSGVAGFLLRDLGVDLRAVRLELAKILEQGPSVVTLKKLPHTPRVRKIMESARAEGQKLGHSYVGTEHLLLGLLCHVPDSPLAEVFVGLGLTVEGVRTECLNLLGYTPPVKDPNELFVLDTSQGVSVGACTCPSLLHGHLPGCPEYKD